jgi:ParB/RepB/Spo0J family partition protein
VAALSAGIQKLPLARLIPSPFNVRSIRTKAREVEIARSLEADGQREPITVYPGRGAEAQRYLIVSGVTRYLAASSVGWNTLDARVDAALDPENTLSLVKASRLHNDTHRETELDRAILAQKLREAGHTVEEIAGALGYGSRRNVTRLKAYFGLPASILERGKTRPEKFSMRLAELLKNAVGIIGEEKTRTLLERGFTENLSLREVERLVHAEKRILQRDASLRPWKTQALDLRLEGDKVGCLNVWETPEQKQKIQFSALMDKAMGERLSAQLAEFLNRFTEEAGETEEAGTKDAGR